MARHPIEQPPAYLTGADRNAWLARQAVKRCRAAQRSTGIVPVQVRIPAHRREEMQAIAAQWRSEHEQASEC